MITVIGARVFGLLISLFLYLRISICYRCLRSVFVTFHKKSPWVFPSILRKSLSSQTIEPTGAADCHSNVDMGGDNEWNTQQNKNLNAWCWWYKREETIDTKYILREFSSIANCFFWMSSFGIITHIFVFVHKYLM